VSVEIESASGAEGSSANGAGPGDRLHPEPRHEALVFERSGPGKVGYSLPPLDVPDVIAIPERLVRGAIEGETEISEVEVARHFTRLSRLNFSIDEALYPLGSCTMKHNPRTNEEMARLAGFAASHPLAPVEVSQGTLELAWRLERILIELTGLARVTLQPSAGAQGELAGILMVRAALARTGNPRSTVLIPDSAHGTNPASAHFAGYRVRELKSNARGTLDLHVLEEAMTEDVAALMLTVPNTLGIFEDGILEIARIVHAKGGYLYCDGANFNSFVGVAKPGAMGIDVMHMNLHKTFSTPHGGGGPGSGPVAVAERLVPFLPRPTIERSEDGSFFLDFDRPDSIGRLRTFLGNFGMFVRALAYICAYGNRIGEVARGAVLNANYIRAGLAGVYHLKYDAPSMHEVVFSDKKQAEKGVHNGDIGKRLMDYGFHPPTISFPLIVHGALMIEPTETEGKPGLDAFIAAMRAIAREVEEDPQIVLNAPHTTPVRRVDEVGAARNLVLRWTPGDRVAEDGKREA
jgi:glycine dehydrogenase subunit 2